MATTKPFDTNNQTALEQIKAEDLNAIGRAVEGSLYDALAAVFGLRTTALNPQNATVVIRGFNTTPPGGMFVTVGGSAAADGGLGLHMKSGGAGSQVSQTSPLYMSVNATLAVEAADPGLDRYDRVVARADNLYVAETELRQVKLVAGGPYVAQNVDKRWRRDLRPGTYAEFLALTADIAVKPGTPGAGVPPALVGDEVALATVRVPAAAAAIVSADITDERVPAVADAALPKIRATILGTDGAGFGPGSILADSLVERGGAAITNMTRAGPGDYTITFSGIGLARSHQATARASLASFANVDGATTATTCQVRTYNAAGAAADRDFDLTIESNGLVGGLY